MDDLLFWLFIIFGLPFLGGPLLIRSIQKMSAQPRVEAVHPTEVPPDLARYLTGVAEALAPDGFTTTAYVTMPDNVPNVLPYLLMLVNEETRDKAMATILLTTAGKTPQIGTRYVEFSTRFSDGRVVDTMNSPVLGSFRAGPEKTATQIPEIQDPRELYRIHQHVLGQVGPGTKVLYPEGDALSYLSRIMVEDYEQQVGFGLLYKDEKAGAYRPTWKGACLMTWGQLWPVSAIRRARIRQRAREVLRSFRAARHSPAYADDLR